MIRRLVLDVLKPHKPSVVELSEALSHLEGVEGVNIIINEIDQQVENAKVIVVGISISFEDVKNRLKELLERIRQDPEQPLLLMLLSDWAESEIREALDELGY